jgi:DNA-binding SARP family transcriptional activator
MLDTSSSSSSVIEPSFSLQLLGGFAFITNDDQTGLPRPTQRMLALLSLARRPLPRSLVAGTLWPESSEAAARSNLRSAISQMDGFRDELVEIRREALMVRATVAVDIDERRALAHRFIDQWPQGEPSPSPHLFEDDLLPAWSDDWLKPERELYRQTRVHVLETLCLRLIGERRLPEAIEACLIGVSADPLRESAHRALINALLAEGNRGKALLHYQHLYDLLQRELGIEPSFRLEDLVAEASAVSDSQHLNSAHQL